MRLTAPFRHRLRRWLSDSPLRHATRQLYAAAGLELAAQRACDAAADAMLLRLRYDPDLFLASARENHG